MQFLMLTGLLEGEAADTAAQTANRTGSIITTVVMLVAMGLLLYFFMYRPQKKQEKEFQNMQNSLAVGDEITTTGGIIGKVVRIREQTVTIMTGKEGTTLRILKSAIRSIDVKSDVPPENDTASDDASKK